MSQESPRPELRVVRGEPTAEEVAALVTALSAVSAAAGSSGSAAGGAAGSSESRSWSRWSDRAALMRKSLPRGPGAWRASAL